MRRAAVTWLVVLGAVACGPAAAWATDAPGRYGLVHGCYSLVSPAGQVVQGGDRLRMQATTLGRYLLYRPDGTFLAAHGDASVSPDPQPSPAADWVVDDAANGAFTLSPMSDRGRQLTIGPGGAGTIADPTQAGDGTLLRFVPAAGCAVYPEAGLNATGVPARGPVPFGQVGGLLEGHMHWMTFEYLGGRFHCGRPWHPYGIQFALPDCASIEGPQGAAAPTQNFLNFGNPAAPHDTRGFPAMTAWGPGNLTYEGTYWRWIERAWMAGLRLMVMSPNENRVLCQLMPTRTSNCDEMDTVRRNFADVRELQRYVDAQAGGPGKGFFQIVTNPYDARRVINQGRMAVVLEIEVSEPFGCIGWDHPTCDQAQVDRGLDEVYGLGVRSMLLLNKFDNPLTGVRFDSGPIGVLINAGNRQSAGSFFDARTCTGKLSDNTIETFVPQASALMDNLLGTLGVAPGTLPAYPPAPHCNTRGLTTLGRHVVRRMMDLHMIVNPDHMSQAGVDDTLTLLETRHYSGVISPHGWMDPGNWPRLWQLGGLAFPGHSAAGDYVKEWQRYRPRQTPYFFGWGYGADLGGLSHQPDPSAGAGRLSYPFRSYDGSVTFDRQRTGNRTFDYGRDGVAHYGLYAEWFADLQRLGGSALAADMWNGAEAYLQMWERADGVPATGCTARRASLTARGLSRVRLGETWETLLQRAGQPQQRTRAWSWCVNGAVNRHAADVAVLADDGRVELAGSTARGRSAAGTAVGARANRLRATTRRVSAGLRERRSGPVVWLYVVRAGRVRAVAAATRALAGRPADLRRAMSMVLAARAAQTPARYEPSAAAAAAHGRLTGKALAGSNDPRLNAALAFLCHLQVQAV